MTTLTRVESCFSIACARGGPAEERAANTAPAGSGAAFTPFTTDPRAPAFDADWSGARVVASPSGRMV